uniref:hypothetical protein n=1 Tax=Shinella sp. TaxID=1870904 RepID=UPI0028A0F4A9
MRLNVVIRDRKASFAFCFYSAGKKIGPNIVEMAAGQALRAFASIGVSPRLVDLSRTRRQQGRRVFTGGRATSVPQSCLTFL